MAFFMASNVSAMHGEPAGLFQRLCLGCYLAWMAMVAFQLSRCINDQTGSVTG